MTDEELRKMSNWIVTRQSELARMDSNQLLALIAALLEYQLGQHDEIIRYVELVAASTGAMSHFGVQVKGHVEVSNSPSDPLSVRGR